MPWHQAPLRLQREVVHPLDDRRQLVDPVLHRRPGQDQTEGRIELLHREGGLGRPVLDSLGLVEHDEVRVPVADDSQIAEELFIVDHEEPAAARVERRAALAGVAVDHGGGRVGEEPPLAEPLGLERGGDDEQPTPDAARVPERVAGGDGLRGLPEAHVVGEEEPPAREEPLDGLSLVRVEALLERPERLLETVEVARALARARDSPAVFLKQSVECGFAAPIPEHGEEFIHDLPPPPRRLGDLERPASRLRGTQPPPESGAGRAVDPADLRQPVARAGERADRVPSQWRLVRDGLPPGLLEGARLRGDVLQHGQQVLAQAERAAEEIGAIAVAHDRVEATEQGAIGPRGRALAPGRVQAEEAAPARPGHDLEPVGLAERDPAQQRLERLAADRPVGLGGDREDVADHQLRWHGPRLPVGAREQRLIGLALDRGGGGRGVLDRAVHGLPCP